MSAKKAKKEAPKGKKKPAPAARDRRTNIINAALAAVFALGVLALLTYSQGWYLPAVSALSTEGYDMDAVTFNYFYRDCYDSFQSAYGEMLQAQGTIDPNAPLDEQDYSSGYAYDGETGAYGYSEESRNSALGQLQYVLSLYEQGERTEEAFAALAAEYSAYKAEDGGLYENALKTDNGTEAQVLNWVFADERTYGDVEHVRAGSGDYLLYWVGEDMPAWEFTARKGLRNEAWNAWYESLSETVVFDEDPRILKHVYLDP